MAKLSIYLHFEREKEAAFLFYKSVFGGNFTSELTRFSSILPQPDKTPVSETDKNLILHIELPIFEKFLLMGSDSPKSMGFNLNFGSNMHLNLETDSKAQTIEFFNALSKNGIITMQPQDMFWGVFYGSCTDQFGVKWMLNYTYPIENKNS